MVASDFETLVDMGFDRGRAELAMKKAGDLSGALEWLEKYQDKTDSEIKELDAEGGATTGDRPEPSSSETQTGEEAKSLICNECGVKLRSQAQAEFHASKTGHVDFAESVEEIAPLTEEEKKAKLEMLREKLAAKRAGTSEQDKLDKKRNEEIRRKTTKETQDIKEDLKKKEQLKEAAAKKREKQEEVEAKARIKAKIAADKEERRQKAEKEKAEREGRQPPAPSNVTIPTAPPVASKPSSSYTETRLRLQLPSSTLQKTFPVDTSLFEVASAVQQDSGLNVASFTQNFPRKTFDTVDFGATLKELGLTPSASLIVR